MYVLQIDDISTAEKEEILNVVKRINQRRKHCGKKRIQFLMYKKELLITDAIRSKDFQMNKSIL